MASPDGFLINTAVRQADLGGISTQLSGEVLLYERAVCNPASSGPDYILQPMLIPNDLSYLAQEHCVEAAAIKCRLLEV